MREIVGVSFSGFHTFREEGMQDGNDRGKLPCLSLTSLHSLNCQNSTLSMKDSTTLSIPTAILVGRGNSGGSAIRFDKS
jgi:hypothetical protein